MFSDHYYVNQIPSFLVVEPIRRVIEHSLVIPYANRYVVISGSRDTPIEVVLYHHPCSDVKCVQVGGGKWSTNY